MGDLHIEKVQIGTFTINNIVHIHTCQACIPMGLGILGKIHIFSFPDPGKVWEFVLAIGNSPLGLGKYIKNMKTL